MDRERIRLVIHDDTLPLVCLEVINRPEARYEIWGAEWRAVKEDTE